MRKLLACRPHTQATTLSKANLNRRSLLDLLKKSPSAESEQLLIRHFASLADEANLAGAENPVSRLTPVDAYKCLFDGVRTERFICAIKAVLEACDKLYKSYTVIDAGTGPVPVMAISAALLSSKARIIGMELDGNSFSEARKVIHSQGLKDRIKMLNVDATNYQFEDGTDVKVIISETMGPALLREPIVKVLRNLKNQFPDAICIPESVKVWPHLIWISHALVRKSSGNTVKPGFSKPGRTLASSYYLFKNYSV